MNSPTVSVVIPTFNVKEIVGDAIESALSQSFARAADGLEILVVDDGSTDGTPELVESLAREDARLRLVRRARNGGPSAARNQGLDEARGAWIALLDADDWMESGRLDSLLALAESAGADIVADNLIVHDGRTGAVRPAFPPWPEEPFGPVSAIEFCRRDRPGLRDMGLGYAKPMLRTDFLRQRGLRYAEDVRIGEDFDFFLRALMQGGRLFFTNAAGYHYQRAWNTVSLSSETQTYENLIRVNRRLSESARQGRHSALARELETRQRMLDSHAPFRDFREAWKSGQYGLSVLRLIRLPFHPYAVRRLIRATMLKLKDRRRQRFRPSSHASINGVAGGD